MAWSVWVTLWIALGPALCLAQGVERSQEEIVEEALASFARKFAKQEADYYPPPPGMMVDPEMLKRELMRDIEVSLTQALQEDANQSSKTYKALERPEVPRDLSGLSKVASTHAGTAHKFVRIVTFGFLALSLMAGFASWKKRKKPQGQRAEGLCEHGEAKA